MTHAILSRLAEWQDELQRLELKRSDDNLLSPEMRDLLWEDVEICQRRIRELERDLELAQVNEEIEDLKRDAA